MLLSRLRGPPLHTGPWRQGVRHDKQQQQQQQHIRSIFTRTRGKPKQKIPTANSTLIGATSAVLAGSLTYILFRNDSIQPLPPTRLRSEISAERCEREATKEKKEAIAANNAEQLSALSFQQENQAEVASSTNTAWGSFAAKFASFSSITDVQWGSVSDKMVDFVLPEWAKPLPDHIRKLQRELSMAPGSLADEIWQEAHDPYLNPEITSSASVRVSSDLCDEEKIFLGKRKKVTTTALAKYLGIPEEEVHPDDVPTIAMVGSGGGLRALVAGTGSMLAASEAGLFNCVTYTAGVSGSCWFQALYNSSISGRRPDRMVSHLKHRLGIHIAYPPAALAALNQAPTNKFLLGGFVEKLKGDPDANFGLVDIYGLLLAARLLIPKGEIGVDEKDLKISNQREYIKHGENPMPIYTAVRHEIPLIEQSEQEQQTGAPSDETKDKAKREAYFQWMEITPYEFFCEEFSAGIPTWAIGRKFKDGKNVTDETGYHVPEVRLPLLLGIFGSAFCATLSHYYKEVKPLLKGVIGFGGLDEMIEGRNEDLSKVHPIDPASIPNFTYGMEGRLPKTTPESLYKCTHLQLMDAGMSNNLPIYPLLRPGRDVDILIAFDASADIRTENWLSVASGYARQRDIKGWPLGAGWPKPTDSPEETGRQLDEAEPSTAAEAQSKLEEAKQDQNQHPGGQSKETTSDSKKGPSDLGYCTVWVGTTEERSSTTDDVPSKAVEEDWQLMEPNAGISVVYFPLLSNPKVEGVDPETSDYMSTWNFIYTSDQVDQVVALAKANFAEGQEKTRRCVRAVYERKKKNREERESKEREARFRRKMRLGVVGKKGEGDHFYLT
ncbi:Lysophospholipase [Venustampulla echinocandica]|uniref:Lysophospholipase n=1 Tax=Venustampulla echinocandica TaxID=2656787 RepID=A0A370TFD5_9HELO|nr:Lysophospholipase [Venustampulla echinocandica]RDL33612.1 Lysophospholipase [Venustampulla echinocandica]